MKPSTKAKKHGLTQEKAMKILMDNTVRGHEITSKQKRFFGAVAGGSKKRKILK